MKVSPSQIQLNLALSIPDHPEGPHFPIGAGVTQTVSNESVTVLNRVGNSAPLFIFPLANPFQYSGNDFIDAHLLDWSDDRANLRPIGLTIYGGSLNDTILGSQTGDELAGGSGDDTIMGQRGQDHIYGDSGFNVDLITRLLTVAVNGNGPTGYPAAQFKNKDLLAAGNDLLYGEGPGSAPATLINTLGNDDDVILGDLGIVTQDVSEPRDVTKPVPAKPQKIQTTILSDQGGSVAPVSKGVLSIDSAALQNGGSDWLYGNSDRDILVGGTQQAGGIDAIDGGIENDLIFGDNVSLGRTYHDTTSLRFQALCGTLLYSRSDEPTCAGFPAVNADNSGQLLVDGVAQAFRDPNDVPWWAEYDVKNLWHDFSADPTVG